MRALNNYVIVKIIEEKSEIVRPSGIVLPEQDGKITTNNGDTVGTRTKLVIVDIDDEHSDLLNKEVIVNNYEMQLFERDEQIYGAVPLDQVKVVFD